jgi:hypothetical protein
VVQRFLNGDDSCGALVRQLTIVTAWHDAYFAQLRSGVVPRWPRRPAPASVPAAEMPVTFITSVQIH